MSSTTTPQRNLEFVRRLEEQVRQHPMCLNLTDEGSSYLVEYPAGDFSVNAVRVSHPRPSNKTKALSKLHKVMERHWKESYPGHIKESK